MSGIQENQRLESAQNVKARIGIKTRKLTIKRLKEVLEYNPETGIFTWLDSLGCSSPGKSAGCIRQNGYMYITIDKEQFRINRLAFFYMEGFFPEFCVDHIDRNPLNNKWNNLRHVSYQCNARNHKLSVINKSGVSGVTWIESRNRWRAQIWVNGRNKIVGTFKNKTKAVKARFEAEIKYGFRPCDTKSSSYQYLNIHQ